MNVFEKYQENLREHDKLCDIIEKLCKAYVMYWIDRSTAVKYVKFESWDVNQTTSTVRITFKVKIVESEKIEDIGKIVDKMLDLHFTDLIIKTDGY